MRSWAWATWLQKLVYWSARSWSEPGGPGKADAAARATLGVGGCGEGSWLCGPGSVLVVGETWKGWWALFLPAPTAQTPPLGAALPGGMSSRG